MTTNCFVCKKAPATSSGGGGLCGKQETLQAYLKDLQHNSHTVAFQQKAISSIMASAPTSRACEGMLKEEMQGMAMATAKEEDTDQKGKTDNRRESVMVNDRLSQKRWSDVSYVTNASEPRRKVHHARPTIHIARKARMSTTSGTDGAEMSQYSASEYSASEANASLFSKESNQTTGSSTKRALRKRMANEPTAKTAQTGKAPSPSKKDNSKRKKGSGSSRPSKDNVSSAPQSVVDKSGGKGLTFSDK